MNCGECVYFERYDGAVVEFVEKGCGNCHRFPPYNMYGEFAPVNKDYWCGEFEEISNQEVNSK